MDFSLIKKAGLTQHEFGSIVGVSRVTVNLWVRGKMHPHRLHAADIQRHLDTLRNGLIDGVFPVLLDPGPQREQAITDAFGAVSAPSI